MNPIKVIGCGVSGLSTALALIEENYPVEIITEKLPQNTTSWKAAAIWFPFHAQPQDKINQWALCTYQKFEALAKIPESGVTLIDQIILEKNEQEPWWKAATPPEALSQVSAQELPGDHLYAYKVKSPVMDVSTYLPFLLRTFQELGGILTQERVEDLGPLLNSDNLVINCTGLEAKELVNDQELYPIQGQILKTAPYANALCVSYDYEIGPKLEDVAYIIPNGKDITLGGTVRKGQESLEPDQQITQEILQRCKALDPKLKDAVIESVIVGLRPGRSSIRLEVEPKVKLIHNYGHGGSGYTVSWGCAQEVLTLIENIASQP